MNWYRQVHKLQVDMTSHCNARCGACIRNVDGGKTKPGLKLSHFDLDLWKRIASEDTKGWYMRQLTLNGNWGDPMMHPNLVEMVKYWTEHHPESFISIATNGSMRTSEFWKELATVLRQGCQHKIDFAVDGMEDTHDIYRRRTVFSKLIENIKSFTDAGGAATVQMTMFEHNKHQIEEVKELSRSIGVREFNARRSFCRDMEIIDEGENYHIKAYYPSGEKDRINKSSELREYFPENDRPLSDLKDGGIYLRANERFREIDINYENSKCPWKDEGEIQIDPWGVAWPCCHISLYGGSEASSGMSIINEFDENSKNIIEHGKENNNLHNDSLQNILNNRWFNGKVNTAIENASWGVCRNNCGVCK